MAHGDDKTEWEYLQYHVGVTDVPSVMHVALGVVLRKVDRLRATLDGHVLREGGHLRWVVWSSSAG